MTEATKSKERIRQFIERWTGRGYEKGDSQVFWLELLHDVLGVERPTEVISFENRVNLSHTSFIDAYIASSKVLIEQKSIDKELSKPSPQSDGTMLSPLEQAKRYAHQLPYSLYPRWVVACNFRSFLIYDMEHPQEKPLDVLLENLEKDAHLLRFIVENVDETHGSASLQREMEVSIEAGALVGKLYDALLTEYGGETNEADLHALNVLCVRLVFCLYAEDAGIFSKCQFAYYLQDFAPNQIRNALRELFRVLDTPEQQRSRFLDAKLKAFPYVNGSLFREQEGEEIPPFTQQTADLLIQEASLGFDWSQISPTIFGAVFESTLNPETRRSGGMHYTSIENIHKVIDPLFYDELCGEIGQICTLPEGKHKRDKLEKFQDRLAGLRFLDPACGSGNFLTETYVSLRRLENRVIEQLTHGQMLLGMEEVNPIKVNIHQFYGIEINDFAVTVAKTALWIAEAQMMAETEKIIRFEDDYLPLKSYNNIAEGNALRIDWNEVCPAEELNYIIGNPPFVGRRYRTESQIEDIKNHFVYKDIDYVACWYKRTAELMTINCNIKAALVSTNSICQGEQVPALWNTLESKYNIEINYAFPTFRWDSESTLKAHVHCVIIAFSTKSEKCRKKRLFFNDKIVDCENINGYLLDAPSVYITNRNKPLSVVPEMKNGNVPLDGDALKIEPEDIDKFKGSLFIKQLMGGRELLHNEKRYVLWLVNAKPEDIKSNSEIYKRVALCKENRLQMKDKGTRKLAETPTLFRDTNNPDNYIALPMVSSERRMYLPMAYLHGDVIPTNQIQTIPDATIYHFAILTSSTHMAWMRAVCGRLKSDYRYSKDIVYNNFPWPTPTDEQKAKIGAHA